MDNTATATLEVLTKEMFNFEKRFINSLYSLQILAAIQVLGLRNQNMRRMKQEALPYYFILNYQKN